MNPVDDSVTAENRIKGVIGIRDCVRTLIEYQTEDYVVGRIKEQQQKGAWPAYVDEHLIPRIYGFEYMMAPYTIAHLKLDMLINWWNDEALAATHNNRLQIYLTNSLDQTELTNKHLLAEMIAREAQCTGDGHAR